MDEKQANQVLENLQNSFSIRKEKNGYEIDNPFGAKITLVLGQGFDFNKDISFDPLKEMTNIVLYELKGQFSKNIADKIFAVLEEHGITLSDDIKNNAIGSVLQSFCLLKPESDGNDTN